MINSTGSEFIGKDRYRHIEVQLTGQDGNAFMVLGLVQRALRREGVPKPEIDAIRDEMMAGDYSHLLGVAMQELDVS